MKAYSTMRVARWLLLATGVSLAVASCGDGRETSRELEPGPPRLVILYSPCTVNKDYLSPFNEEISFTPHLAEFAEDSAVFGRHMTEAGSSGIAYASILTGSQADHHGIFHHPARLEDDLYLIAEAYAENGYETFLWTAHSMASPALNYHQGVTAENIREKPALWFRISARLSDAWRSLLGRSVPRRPRPSLTANDSAFLELLERLQEDPEYKAFVMANFTVTHGSYPNHNLDRFRREYPDETRNVSDADIAEYEPVYRENGRPLSWDLPGTAERLGLAEADLDKLADVIELLYKSNINYLDRLFGELVEQVQSRGLLDQSLIVFTADHGEVMYRENASFPWSHSHQLAPESLGVPLLIRAPLAGLTPGIYQGVTRSIDVFPTMAGLSGFSIDSRHGLQGVDLSPALRGETGSPDLLAYSHTAVLHRATYEQMHDPGQAGEWTQLRTFYPDRDVDLIWVSVRDRDHLFKWRNLDGRRWGLQVFDLTNDAAETRDLYDSGNPRHREMETRLLEYKERLAESYRERLGERSDAAMPDAEEAEALRALGYIK